MELYMTENICRILLLNWATMITLLSTASLALSSWCIYINIGLGGTLIMISLLLSTHKR